MDEILYPQMGGREPVSKHAEDRTTNSVPYHVYHHDTVMLYMGGGGGRKEYRGKSHPEELEGGKKGK